MQTHKQGVELFVVDDSLKVQRPHHKRPGAVKLTYYGPAANSVVYVQSYLPGCLVDREEAIALASDALAEEGFQHLANRQPDEVQS